MDYRLHERSAPLSRRTFVMTESSKSPTPAGNWPSTESEVDGLAPGAGPGHRRAQTPSARQWGAILRSPVMWFMILVVALSVAALLALWVMENRRTPTGPRDPLSFRHSGGLEAPRRA